MPKVRTGTKSQKKNNRLDLKLFGGILGLGLVIVVSAFFLGRSDAGQIDVAATITSSNEERVAGGDTTAPTPVPKNTDKPFGGLISSGRVNAPEPKPQPEVDGTATSSEETASSTDEELESDLDLESETTDEVENTESSNEEASETTGEEQSDT